MVIVLSRNSARPRLSLSQFERLIREGNGVHWNILARRFGARTEVEQRAGDSEGELFSQSHRQYFCFPQASHSDAKVGELPQGTLLGTVGACCGREARLANECEGTTAEANPTAQAARVRSREENSIL